MTRRDTDPRQERTRARVHAAARAVLRREGVGGTTMDAIAFEAGVARSTLYRNWDSRDDLLLAALDELSEPGATAPDLPASERLVHAVLRLVHGLHDSEWGATLPALAAAIDASAEHAARYGAVADEHRAELLDIVADGVAAGELPAPLAADDLVDVLVGPLFHRRLVRRIRTSSTWACAHVERTLAAFGCAVDGVVPTPVCSISEGTPS